MKDLEKKYDLESCGQVQVPHIGTSSVANLQHRLQEDSTSIAAESKGKGKEPEIQVIETLVMAEKPQTSRAPDQTQVSPIQVNPPEVSGLQTPSKQEKTGSRSYSSQKVIRATSSQKTETRSTSRCGNH